jgi:Phage tail lysozyme
MTKLSCGSTIRRFDAANLAGAAGCLVQFQDVTDKLLLLTAGHVLVGRTAKQFDAVTADDLPGQAIGCLFGWTSLDGPTTTDAALVHVDPALVVADIGSLGAPNGPNFSPAVGDTLTIVVNDNSHTAEVSKVGDDVSIDVVGPDFRQTVMYRNQIVCTGIAVDGCAGSMAVDSNKKIVGMVVGGDTTAFTLVTPIDALLSHPDWGNGPPLTICSAVPSLAKAPNVVTMITRATPPPIRSDRSISDITVLAGKALNFFMQHGWTKEQSVGLLANIQAESSFDFKCIGDGGAAFGLCQWHPDRQGAFLKLNGHKIQDSTFAEQLAFINFELRQGNERKAGGLLAMQATPASAAKIISTFYERPADTANSEVQRAKLADEWFRIFG